MGEPERTEVTWLRTFFIDHMVGSMSQVFTFKNATKPKEELYNMTIPRIVLAEAALKSKLLDIVAEARDKDLPLAYIERRIHEL